MIYLSSLAFGTSDLRELISLSNRHELPLELSYTNHAKDVTAELRLLRQPFIFHNYFPRPSEDFTINLASTNTDIRVRAIEHCIEAIQLSDHFNVGFFAVHAGYRVDIPPSQLGGKFESDGLVDHARAMSLFKSSLEEILERTSVCRTVLLIENNVITEENITRRGENPVLMCDGADFLEMFDQMKETRRLGVLIDVGHLKVASNTLSFDPVEMLKQCRTWIRGYHLSENDGKQDTNDLLRDDSWFWPYLGRGLDYYTLEIRTTAIEEILTQMKLTQSLLQTARGDV